MSTGALPTPEAVQALIDQAHRRYRGDRRGEVSRVYPALARAPADRFGLCVVGVTGNTYPAGDAHAEFTIMSVAKPFVFAVVCHALDPERVRHVVGVNATGQPFNSLAAVEQSPDGRTNPDGQPRSDRHHEPRPRIHTGCEMGIPP